MTHLTAHAPLSMTHIVGALVVLVLFFSIPMWAGSLWSLFQGMLGLAVSLTPVPYSGRGWSLGAYWRTRRQARNYAVLGEYLPRLAARGLSEEPFRLLATRGISPQVLRGRIEQALVDAERERLAGQVRDMLTRTETAAELDRLSARHRGLLAEAEVELAKMRSQRQMIAGLVDRLNRKHFGSDEQSASAKSPSKEVER